MKLEAKQTTNVCPPYTPLFPLVVGQTPPTCPTHTPTGTHVNESMQEGEDESDVGVLDGRCHN